jgi:hypothetical protein
MCAGPACSLRDWIAEEFPYPIDEYQLRFSYFSFAAGRSSQWVGSDIGQLLDQRGPPDLMLEARPKYGEYRYGMPAVSYVYRPDPGSGTQCYETYVVIEATGKIDRYYCR